MNNRVNFLYTVITGYKSIMPSVQSRHWSKKKAVVQATALRLQGKQNVAVIRTRNGMNPRLIALYGSTNGETTTVRPSETVD